MGPLGLGTTRGASTPAVDRRRPVVAAGLTASAACRLGERCAVPRRVPCGPSTRWRLTGATTPAVERRSDRGADWRVEAATVSDRRAVDPDDMDMEEKRGAAGMTDSPRPPAVQSGVDAVERLAARSSRAMPDDWPSRDDELRRADGPVDAFRAARAVEGAERRAEARRSRPSKLKREAASTERRTVEFERRGAGPALALALAPANAATSDGLLSEEERTPESTDRLTSGRPGACGARPAGRAPAGPPEVRPTRLVDGVAEPDAPCAAFPLTRPRCGWRRRAMAVGPELGPRLERPRMLEAIGRAREGAGSSVLRRRWREARMASRSLSRRGSSPAVDRLTAAG